MHGEEHINRLINAVATRLRRVMLVRLAERPCSASELAARCDASPDAIAAGLAILGEAQLLTADPESSTEAITVTDQVTMQRKAGRINLCVADEQGTFIRMLFPEEHAPLESAANER